jgi:hypothetical protein
MEEEKQKIGLMDSSFAHQEGASRYFPPTSFKWDRSINLANNKAVVFTDNCLVLAKMPAYKNKIKIAYLVEPEVIYPQIYQHIRKNWQDFDLIFTHHKQLLKIDPRFRWYSNGQSWVKPEDWKKWPKTKNIAMIASWKNWAPGHRMRHILVNHIRKNNYPVDIYGSGYKPIENKIDVLRDYKFIIECENCQIDNYYTEKLIDAYATWTYPIYWGSPRAGDVFCMPKVYNFTELELFDAIMHTLVEEEKTLYDEMSSEMERNLS